ncbi:MAG TPA: aminotransferase class I/II-fold pyridoxal phosphate-dependent enzyme, partial [Candidatus Agrococcus pullicola]|nr:aminotransferase class I/II-fold pyridoxal phosphate-dependent enzyme [Candidatus Agrococcus pullicola]
GVHALPIDLSTTYPMESVESGGEAYDTMAAGGRVPDGGTPLYARLWNPTVARFESALAKLEHAEAAVAFGSGMAAASAALLAFAAATGERHVVAVRPLYGGTDHLLASGLLGTEVTYCSADSVSTSLREDTGIVIVETPANPTLDLVNIRSIADQAGPVPVMVDNTFATPVLQNPLLHGAALSMHSATKYLGGHGDVMGGVIACSEEHAAMIRPVRALTGGVLHPVAAYTLHRGLTTLPVRVNAQQRTAAIVAKWLSEHPAIADVFYPGFDGDPAGCLGEQMRGPGAMLAIRLAGGYDAAAKLASSLQLFTHAVSLGGVDSLIEHPAGLTHRLVEGDARPDAGVLRLSIGLESAEDLIADLERGLAA